jgi:hypothetical protein
MSSAIAPVEITSIDMVGFSPIFMTEALPEPLLDLKVFSRDFTLVLLLR